MTNTTRLRLLFVNDGEYEMNRKTRRFVKRRNKKEARHEFNRVTAEAVRDFYAQQSEDYSDYLFNSGYDGDDQMCEITWADVDDAREYERDLAYYYDDYYDPFEHIYDHYIDEPVSTGPTHNEIVIWVNEMKQVFDDLNYRHIVKKFGVSRFRALSIMEAMQYNEDAGQSLGDILGRI